MELDLGKTLKVEKEKCSAQSMSRDKQESIKKTECLMKIMEENIENVRSNKELKREAKRNTK